MGGGCHARACANPRGEAMARRVRSPGSPPHPAPDRPQALQGLRVMGTRQSVEIVKWHTRRRQRGKHMQIDMLRKRRAARPRVRLPPPPCGDPHMIMRRRSPTASTAVSRAPCVTRDQERTRTDGGPSSCLSPRDSHRKLCESFACLQVFRPPRLSPPVPSP